MSSVALRITVTVKLELKVSDLIIPTQNHWNQVNRDQQGTRKASAGHCCVLPGLLFYMITSCLQRNLGG